MSDKNTICNRCKFDYTGHQLEIMCMDENGNCQKCRAELSGKFADGKSLMVGADMVNNPPHYKDASGIECIEVTQHMRFCEGNSFKYVYRAGSKGNLIEDLKKAAWYAERSWTRSRSGNDRIHWLVQRKGEAIADSREKQGKTFIAEVMRNIVNNRWWQAYDSLMTEIERLESEAAND